METIKPKTGQNLGIAAIITAIVTFMLAVIPCIGIMAIIPGVITIIMGAVGLMQSSRENSPNGLSIAGLIIAVIACLISISQIFVAAKLIHESGAGRFHREIRGVVKEFRSDIWKNLEDEDVSIKIDIDGDKIEIDSKARILEELEQSNDALQTK